MIRILSYNCYCVLINIYRILESGPILLTLSSRVMELFQFVRGTVPLPSSMDIDCHIWFTHIRKNDMRQALSYYPPRDEIGPPKKFPLNFCRQPWFKMIRVNGLDVVFIIEIDAVIPCMTNCNLIVASSTCQHQHIICNFPMYYVPPIISISLIRIQLYNYTWTSLIVRNCWHSFAANYT